MKLNPKISLIIPVLNNKSQFSVIIESLCKNNTNELEILVVDGGSTDGTISVIKEHEKSIYYWESGQDQGIADAFNRGIQKSTGDLVAILNSDDFWEDSTLETLLNAYISYPDAEVFYGDLRFINEADHESYIKKPNLKRMKYRMNIFHPAMFIKKSTYNKVGLYNQDYLYAMDSEWCHRAQQLGIKFHYIPQVLASMRLGGTSDVEYKKSLNEYRLSTVEHKLASAFEARLYYNFFVFMKIMMKNKFIWKLVRKIT